VRLGALSDDVADHVQSTLEREPLPFFVLTSCSRGQRSHFSEELGASVFAHYLDQGLRGQAEGFGKTGIEDQRIFVRELADFVRARVDRWTWLNRGARQEPRLWGKAGDFGLLQVAKETDDAKRQVLAKYPDWLKSAWVQRDKLQGDESYRLAPRPFRLLEQTIFETEKAWRAGLEEDRLKEGLTKKLEPLLEHFSRLRVGKTPRPVSLADLADSKTEETILDFRSGLVALLTKAPEPEEKVAEADKTRVEEFNKIRMEIVEKVKKLPFETGAAVVVDTAVRTSNLTPGKLLALLSLLREIRPVASSERLFTETVFLARLQELFERTKEQQWDWPLAFVHQAMKVTIEAEGLLAEFGQNPETLLPWNLALWSAGEEYRRRGEKSLFAGSDFDWREGQSALTQADQHYRQIPPRLEILRQMLRERDKAYLQLPGWAPYLVALGRVDPQEDTAWRGGVQAATRLAELLEAQQPDILAGEPNALLQWRSNAAAWQRSIDARMTNLLRIGDNGAPRDYLELHALLESSRLSAPQRETLWKSANRLGLKLNEKAVAFDDADDRGDPQPYAPGDDPTARQESDRAQRRVRVAVDLLRLTPLESTDAFEDRADKAFKSTDPQALQDFARDFSDVWTTKLPALFRLYVGSDTTKSNLARADRLSRIFPGQEIDRQTNDSQLTYRNPALARRRVLLEQFANLLRTRYQEESRALQAQQSRQAPFFAGAASDVPRP
jgi:hypothetical protein